MELKLVLVVVAALAVLPVQALGQPAAVPFIEPDEAALSVELTAEPESYDRPSSDGATELRASGLCSTVRLGGIDLTLGWAVKREGIQAHRVDISKFHDGFAKGRFLTSGERPAGETGLVFETPEPGIYYYWRLLTKSGEGWIVSGSDRVQSPVCPVDKVYE